MLKRFFGIMAIFLVVGAIGCSSSSTPTTSNPSGGNSITISLSAQGLAFDKSTITVPHGATVVINFANNDNGVVHNFALYQSGDATGKATGPIYVGQTITGVKSITYTFTAPSSPGTYFFRCDTHPTMMIGNFIVT